MRRLLFVFLVPFLFSVPETEAQQIARARLEGTVLDMMSGQPLEGVHVFVSRSEIGSVTNESGRFIFNLPLGAHRLVVSRIGHKTQTHDVMIRAPRAYLLDFDLEEDVMQLGELTVSDEPDPDWPVHLESFTEFFLGATDNAEHVEILNPEILDFAENDGMLFATAAEPLMLINRALGYRVEHHLHQFIVDGDETWQDGESFFIEMTPTTEKEAKDWEKNRKMAFNGSANHFFESLMDNRTRQEGFLVYQTQEPGEVGRSDEYRRNSAAPLMRPQFAVNPTVYLTDGSTDNEKIMGFPGYLHIVYTREEEDRAYAEWQRLYHSGETRDVQHSWISLSGAPATLDAEGNVLDPYSVRYYGYMSFERIADTLPKEYRPEGR